MKILFCGDVVGRAGRDLIVEKVPELRERFGLDMVIVNGENAAHGFGITKKISEKFFEAGVDVITTGNHVWDQREALIYVNEEPRLLRPLNFPSDTPGRGAYVCTLSNGRKVLVVLVMGRFVHGPSGTTRSPPLKPSFQKHTMGASVDAIVVDFHAEATSEKQSMGAWLDGRVSLVVGTHTHVPSADTRILPQGTAYQTDAGMCGAYDSIIGMKKEAAVSRFVRKVPSGRLEPADGEATLCGVYVETNDKTGLATNVSPVRIGGGLAQVMPD